MYHLFTQLLCLATVMGASIPSMHRETLKEAAVNTKKLIEDVSVGTMSSIFSDGDNVGRPFALMEYHAPCHPAPSLTFLLMPISLSTHNILQAASHHATYTVATPPKGSKSPMSFSRAAFIGNMTFMPETTPTEHLRLKECYLKYHPDAKYWLPGTPGSPHMSMWARLDIEDIYYVGGFGDTHYIGHIPMDLYSQAGEESDAEDLAWSEEHVAVPHAGADPGHDYDLNLQQRQLVL